MRSMINPENTAYFDNLCVLCYKNQAMKLLDVLKKYNFPASVTDIFRGLGIEELYPPQTAAINKGILEGKSLLMSVPTAAGKTLIAELCMLHSIVHAGGRCLYIAPLKALASEKFEDFRAKYSPLGIHVGLAIGDLDTPVHERALARYQILIATAEKVDSLLRSKASSLISNLTVVVLDEIHFINDGSRGPVMEILTARIKQMNPKVQFLALSATVKNADELADWLQAEYIKSTWRPIPLKEGVYFNETIQFDKYGTRLVREEAEDDLSKITLDTLRGKGQVLIFVNSRRSAQAASRQIAPAVDRTLKPEEKKQLVTLSKEIIGPPSHATKVCRKLAEVILHGSAFHHAGLKPVQRKLIEDHFKKNLIKVICSTPTLAAGVNLPARRAIIRDCKRFESGLGMSYIPTSEYKQCAGRAGRPQYDDYGEAVLIAKSFSETQTLFDKYIHADPEPVISKLGEEAALRIHILASIAAGYVHDIKEMFEFLSHTFLSHQRLTPNLLELVTRIFDFLLKEKFIEKNGFRFFATTFGQAVSRLYIDPITALTLRNGLKKLNSRKEGFTSLGMLHLITCCPDSPILNVGQSDYEEVEAFASHHKEELIVTPDDVDIVGEFEFYVATLKTAWMLSQWTEEEKEETICDQFGIGPGDVYRHLESAEWLLHAAVIVADLFGFRNIVFALDKLKQRITYGIKEELLELAQLKGVGRVRARNLYASGFKSLKELKFSSAEELSKVGQIGKALAKDIMEQVTQPIRKKRASFISVAETTEQQI